jgi:hypothetical protein
MRFVQAAALPVLHDSNLTGQVKKALPMISRGPPRQREK